MPTGHGLVVCVVCVFFSWNASEVGDEVVDRIGCCSSEVVGGGWERCVVSVVESVVSFVALSLRCFLLLVTLSRQRGQDLVKPTFDPCQLPDRTGIGTRQSTSTRRDSLTWQSQCKCS